MGVKQLEYYSHFENIQNAARYGREKEKLQEEGAGEEREWKECLVAS